MRPLLALALLASALPLAAATPAEAASPDVVLAEVYGGGGNSGATLRRDFVELQNRSAAPVDLDGWSVQYASASGTTWLVTPLSGSIAPGERYLVAFAQGTGGSQDLPPVQATGTTNLSGTAGKVALATTTARVDGPASPTVRDFVGYGSANQSERSPAPAPANPTSVARTGADTDDNAADFVVGEPTPGRAPAGPTPPAGEPCAVSAPTPVPELQGRGATSPLDGQTVTTRGVVVARTPGLSGFFLQDPVGDGDPLTSDGVFVFAPDLAVPVAPGDEVAVTGRVTEFQTLTEVDRVAAVQVCGTRPVPEPVTYTLPEPVEGDLERVEGMLVRIPTGLTVQQSYFLGRFGQLTVGAGGRRYQPTDLHPAGSPQARALADENARSLLVLDDGSSRQNPAPVPYLDADGTRRSGDLVEGLIGVVDAGAVGTSAVRDHRLHPVAPPAFSSSGRPVAPEPVGGTLRAASFNVLNYFTTLGRRGATTAEELERQRAKLFAALAGLDADVVGLVELQNDAVAPQDLVDGLNAFLGTPRRWAVVPDPVQGVGTDEIKVAQVYRTDRVALVGPSASPVDQSAFDGVGRPPVAQTYRVLQDDAVVSLVVNHFKSKGSCPTTSGPDSDQGDGQGCWNATRVRQAEALGAFVGEVQRASADDDVLVVGDLNAYGKEDPVLALTRDDALVDLLARDQAGSGHSYVFDGQSGHLDHALATPSLAAQAVRATAWHVNADEPSFLDYNTEFKTDDRYAPTPYRSSDHDPVLVGLDLVGPPPVVSVADAEAVEGAPLRFTVSLDRPAAHDVAVQVDTVLGTAAAEDVTAVTRRVVVPAGTAQTVVEVPTTADAVDEGDESVQLVLSSLDGAVAGDLTAEGLVRDDDTAVLLVDDVSTLEPDQKETALLPFVVRLSTPADRDVRATVRTADGTATAGQDYLPLAREVLLPAGTTQVAVPVTVLGDRRKEGPETVRLLLDGAAPARGTVLDDEKPRRS